MIGRRGVLPLPPSGNAVDPLAGADQQCPRGILGQRQDGMVTHGIAVGRPHRAGGDEAVQTVPCGHPHIAHIRANTGIMLDAHSLGKLIDDMPTQGKAADVIARNTKVVK